MKNNNVKYKKVTIELPVSTYNMMKEYCKGDYLIKFFYKDFINFAIIDYLDRHYYDN